MLKRLRKFKFRLCKNKFRLREFSKRRCVFPKTSSTFPKSCTTIPNSSSTLLSLNYLLVSILVHGYWPCQHGYAYRRIRSTYFIPSSWLYPDWCSLLCVFAKTMYRKKWWLPAAKPRQRCQCQWTPWLQNLPYIDAVSNMPKVWLWQKKLPM